MSLPSRFPVLSVGALLMSACIQTIAPTIVPGAEPVTSEFSRAHPSGTAPATPAAAEPARPAFAADAPLASHDLIIPVAGVAADELRDSFDAPRSGGRLHHAIDIMAPWGTPILAADDGRVLRLSYNPLGGITIYAIDPTGHFVYYYAHLEAYRPGLAVGESITKGDTLGYVGTTGDAPENLPHLHFQILRMPANGRYWDGQPIDPYPLLTERSSHLAGR